MMTQCDVGTKSSSRRDGKEMRVKRDRKKKRTKSDNTIIFYTTLARH